MYEQKTTFPYVYIMQYIFATTKKWWREKWSLTHPLHSTKMTIIYQISGEEKPAQPCNKLQCLLVTTFLGEWPVDAHG